MSKSINKVIDKEFQKNTNQFLKKVDSRMHYRSNFSGDALSFEWLDEIDFCLTFLDNIVRNPKLSLVREENVVKIEKSKRVTVDSIKDLSKHTNYISKIDRITEDVQPSKILDIRNEETYNIYENRFFFTLYNNLVKFVTKKEEELKDFETRTGKALEYSSSSKTNNEKINIELKITSSEIPKKDDGKKFDKEIKDAKKRINNIKYYFASWSKSDIIKALEKAHVPAVQPPIKKTNVILKNPNFQVAMRLWNYLQTYGLDDEDSGNVLDSQGNESVKELLEQSFLLDYFVLDSISTSKKIQKEKLAKYAAIMINQQIKKVISILINSGVEISEEEILGIIINQINDEKSKRLAGSTDVKKKFENAMDEYLERTKDFL